MAARYRDLYAEVCASPATTGLHLTYVIGTYPLHPMQDVPEAGFFGRLTDDIKLWMK